MAPQAPQLPGLPAHLAKDCADPGIDPDARIAVIEHRQAWKVCRDRHGNLVRFYNDLANELGDRAPVR